MGPIMESGLVDVLGFIGGTRGADALIAAHPAPHRLKVPYIYTYIYIYIYIYIYLSISISNIEIDS